MLAHAVASAALFAVSTAAVAAEPAAATTAGAPAAAPSPAREVVPPPRGRVLGGHVFMPSFIVQGALPTTSFGTAIVLAYGTTSASVQVGDETFSGDFDYAGIGSVLGYEHAFGDYFSGRFSINNIIFSGIDGPSAIVVGTQLQFGGSVGATASLPIGDSLRVGVLFDAGITPGLALTIANGVRSIIDSCNAGDCRSGQGEIFGIEKAVTLQPALAANWAPWRPLGITANAAFLRVDQFSGEENFSADAVILGAAADLDFNPLYRVPIGLQLAFSWTAPVSGDILQHVTDLGAGLFYTGRQNLALGLQLVSRRFAVQPNVDVSWSTFITTIGLRYYW